jgi:hypothetical protein
MENNIFDLTINGKIYRSGKPVINGKHILELVGLHHSTDYEILMKLTAGEFEPIELDEDVDLKKKGVEAFLVKPYPHVSIEVDDEKYPVTEVLMTPVEIMVLAGLDPKKHYLKQIIGHTDITYKNDPEHVIGIVDCMKFSSCKIANTTVS